jgi:hypothetical protein
VRNRRTARVALAAVLALVLLGACQDPKPPASGDDPNVALAELPGIRDAEVADDDAADDPGEQYVVVDAEPDATAGQVAEALRAVAEVEPGRSVLYLGAGNTDLTQPLDALVSQIDGFADPDGSAARLLAGAALEGGRVTVDSGAGRVEVALDGGDAAAVGVTAAAIVDDDVLTDAAPVSITATEVAPGQASAVAVLSSDRPLTQGLVADWRSVADAGAGLDGDGSAHRVRTTLAGGSSVRFDALLDFPAGHADPGSLPPGGAPGAGRPRRRQRRPGRLGGAAERHVRRRAGRPLARGDHGGREPDRCRQPAGPGLGRRTRHRAPRRLIGRTEPSGFSRLRPMTRRTAVVGMLILAAGPALGLTGCGAETSSAEGDQRPAASSTFAGVATLGNPLGSGTITADAYAVRDALVEQVRAAGGARVEVTGRPSATALDLVFSDGDGAASRRFSWQEDGEAREVLQLSGGRVCANLAAGRALEALGNTGMGYVSPSDRAYSCTDRDDGLAGFLIYGYAALDPVTRLGGLMGEMTFTDVGLEPDPDDPGGADLRHLRLQATESDRSLRPVPSAYDLWVDGDLRLVRAEFSSLDAEVGPYVATFADEEREAVVLPAAADRGAFVFHSGTGPGSIVHP